jgi:hypothetical protein
MVIIYYWYWLDQRPLTTINVLAQQLSPAPYKGRFFSINTTVFQGISCLVKCGMGWLAGQLTTLRVFGIASISNGYIEHTHNVLFCQMASGKSIQQFRRFLKFVPR